MAVAPKTNGTAGAVNLDATVTSKAASITIGSGDAVLVFVAVRGKVATVSSVTDGTNTYTKLSGGKSYDTLSYELGHYAPFSRTANDVDGELWACTNASAATAVTVTLTSGAKFAFAVAIYTGANTSAATAFPSGNRAAAGESSDKPSASATLDSSASYLVAGFISPFVLDDSPTPVHGTFRKQAAGSTVPEGISVGVADFTGNTTAVVQIAPPKTNNVPTSTVVTDDDLPFDRQQINSALSTVAPVVRYIVCSTEVHA